jgi:hypothetical protein
MCNKSSQIVIDGCPKCGSSNTQKRTQIPYSKYGHLPKIQNLDICFDCNFISHESFSSINKTKQRESKLKQIYGF